MSLEVPSPRAWTREEFQRAADAGVFRPDERLELLDGQIVPKMTQNAPHAVAIRLVSRWLDSILPSGYDLRGQAPVALSEHSQPEPDVAVVTGSTRDYVARHPGPREIALLVEVSDTTVRSDQRDKTALYGSAGIPEFWIVDINRRRLFVHIEPEGGVYRMTRVLQADEEIAPAFAPDRRIRIADLLP